LDAEEDVIHRIGDSTAFYEAAKEINMYAISHFGSLQVTYHIGPPPWTYWKLRIELVLEVRESPIEGLVITVPEAEIGKMYNLVLVPCYRMKKLKKGNYNSPVRTEKEKETLKGRINCSKIPF
jgi:hypothetical protein